MIDIVGLPAGVTLSPDDFSFRTTPTHEWRALGNAGVGVSLRRGAGIGGSDRVTLVWPDYDPGAPAAGRAVANAWLEVTVKATAATGLPWPDVFYFGNLVAESGDGTEPWDLNIRVTATDVARTRASLLSAAPITNPFDYNRDGRVNVTDVALVRSDVGRYIEKVGIGGPGPTAAAAMFARAAPRRRRAFDGLTD
jgi:hypothetical protein